MIDSTIMSKRRVWTHQKNLLFLRVHEIHRDVQKKLTETRRHR